MKFLCDQCKAKYQIADDKVAGKTVRMKCRKCGHMIEVRAAVTETSVSIDIPREELNAPGPQAQPPPRPPKPAPPARTGGGLATSLAAQKPPPPKPARPSAAPASGGLAGAFTRNVHQHHDKDDALELLELHVTDEWYVAINGVPVGPVRIAELRRKAAAGAVTEDSLVLQEGLEEWRPVKAINELAVVVREAIAGGRVSLATPPPGEVRQSSPPAPPRPPAPTPARPATSSPFAPLARPAPAAPAGPPPAAARSNVVPITAARGPATAEKLEEAPRLSPAPPSPFAPPAPISAPASARTSVAPDPFAAPLAAPASTVSAPIGPSLTPAPVAPKRATPWLAIAMVVLAAAFGVTAAIILLVRTPAPQPVVIQMPSAAPATPPPPTDMGDVPPPDTTPSATAPSTPGKSAAAMHGPKSTTPSNPGTPAPTNSAIAALLGGNNGPTPGPSPGGGGGGGGSSLSADQVERTVHNYQAGVRRSCYDRLATDKTGTVQVTVTATVGPSGSVQSANADGNEPMIAKCIEGAVRGWQFPATGSTTTVRIPFKFVRQ